MQYSAALKKALAEASPAEGLTRAEMEECVAAITEQLKMGMSDNRRIELCAERESFRKALAKTAINP